MSALGSVVAAITRSGSTRPWRVDLATYQEMYAELEAWSASRGRPVLHDGTTGAPLVCGCPVSVWFPPCGADEKR